MVVPMSSKVVVLVVVVVVVVVDVIVFWKCNTRKPNRVCLRQ